MNYLDACKPLLAHVAHLSLIAANPRSLPEPAHAARDIGQLILRAKTGLHDCDDESKRLIGFAVNAWLAEKLALLPCGREAAPLLDPLPADAGALFFHHLHTLLLPDAGRGYSRHRIGVLEVYAACLETGFVGCYADKDDRTNLELYRERCRQLLSQVYVETTGATQANRDETDAHADSRAGTAAMWLFPIVLTVFLYTVYRTVLGQLFRSVVG